MPKEPTPIVDPDTDFALLQKLHAAQREWKRADQSPEARLLGDHLEYLDAKKNEILSRIMCETNQDEVMRIHRDLAQLLEVRRNLLSAVTRYLALSVYPFAGIERAEGFVAKSWGYKEADGGRFLFTFLPACGLDSVNVLLDGEQAEALKRFIDGSRSGAV